MSRNGAGTYSLVAGNPVITGTTISSTWANNSLTDIATALTASIANDGQTPILANLPMSGFKHTGAASASALTDYARADQTQNSAFQVLSSVSGADTITANATPTPAAYAAGQAFRFVSAGANTGAATLNVSSLGAKAITKNGTTALVAGDIPSGAAVEVVYDGTRFQLGLVGLKAGDIGVTVQAYDAQLSSLIRQNSQSAAYTTVLTDGGKQIFHPSADTTARTFTIDSNANVAYPIGTAITFINQNGAGVVTIAITSDTMRLAITGATGSRTLAANGIATAVKITSTEWIISGSGLT